jgi:hypothetical protein
MVFLLQTSPVPIEITVMNLMMRMDSGNGIVRQFHHLTYLPRPREYRPVTHHGLLIQQRKGKHKMHEAAAGMT